MAANETDGRLFDTNVAALQPDRADVTPDAFLLGVVRRPTPWFYAAVDENEPGLGPPEELLEAFQQRRERLLSDGLPEAKAHNQAAEDVSFADRYWTYLEASDEAGEALQDIRERLAGGRDVALVCYENTDEKRCHRTVLREYLESVDW